MIIGIGHRMRSGKNTLAEFIAEAIPNVVIDAFAVGLKNTLLQLFPMIKPDHLFGDDRSSIIPGIKINGKEANSREIMQYFGTEVCRSMYADVWANQLIHRAEMQKDKIIICADVRFPNEAAAIKRHGGILIKVERDNIAVSDHISEHLLDNYNGWDHIIQNNSSLEHLKSEALRLAAELDLERN